MARQRMLHPGFFTDGRICSLPPLHRILFQGLWCEADRDGRLKERPVDLKIRLLPMDNCDLPGMLADLATAGLIVRYEVDGDRLVSIPNFLRYQKPHQNEVAGKIQPPPFPAGSPAASVVAHFASASTISPSPSTIGASASAIGGLNRAETVTVTETVKETLSANLPTGEESEKPDSPAREVFDHWRAAMGKTAAAKLDAKRAGAIRARLRDGYTVEDLKRAVDGCKATPHNMGQNDRGEKYDDLGLICRDAAHVDRFMANAGSPPVGSDPPKPKWKPNPTPAGFWDAKPKETA